MKIAIFSDIHGNAIALEAVLKDIKTRQIDLVFCLGDLVGYGAYPNEVIDLIRSNHIPSIMGNYDDAVGYNRDDCGCDYKDPQMIVLGLRSLDWMKEHVGAENKIYLRGLLHRLEFNIFGQRVLLVHGSPRKINEYLVEDHPAEFCLQLINEAETDVLVCGHTHLANFKNLEGKFLINPGSVGKPKDGDSRAGYLIIQFEESKLNTEIVRVPYDVEAMARAIEATDLPHQFAEALRQATG